MLTSAAFHLSLRRRNRRRRPYSPSSICPLAFHRNLRPQPLSSNKWEGKKKEKKLYIYFYLRYENIIHRRPTAIQEEPTVMMPPYKTLKYLEHPPDAIVCDQVGFWAGSRAGSRGAIARSSGEGYPILPEPRIHSLIFRDSAFYPDRLLLLDLHYRVSLLFFFPIFMILVVCNS